MSEFRRAVPVLAAAHIEETAELYRRLGFEVAQPMDSYLIAERGQAEVHVALSSESVPEKAGCYFLVTGIDALFTELIENGIRVEPPIMQPWGLREMYVMDPSGNLIRFAEAIGNGM